MCVLWSIYYGGRAMKICVACPRGIHPEEEDYTYSFGNGIYKIILRMHFSESVF